MPSLMIADLMALFVLRGDLVIPDRQVTVCRDPEDNMVIEAALAGEAPWVVTGDEDLLSLGTYETVSFVTRATSWRASTRSLQALAAMKRQAALTKRS
jgi:uncharacterized protein